MLRRIVDAAMINQESRSIIEFIMRFRRIKRFTDAKKPEQ